MQTWFEAQMAALLTALALPKFGLSTVFLVAFVSATLIPLGSEPAVFGLVKLNPSLFWPAILVATLGNTLGGAVSWWMGRGAEAAVHRARERREVHAQAQAHGEVQPPEPPPSAARRKAMAWLQRWGAKACLLSWLPIVGDPLCAVAGWLRLPFWPCVLYMAIGKFARYLTITGVAMWVMPGAL